ncbi:MAG: hypothetical protein ACK5MG_01370 [Bacteroidales bacterium]
MKLENSKRVRQIKSSYYLSLLLGVVSIAILFWKGVDDIAWIVLVLTVISFFASQLVSLNYIDYKSSEKNIIIKYYSVLAVSKEYQQIEFPTTSLADVKKEKCCGKMMEELILAVRTTKGIAEYEPISLLGLSKKEQQEMMIDLNNILAESPSRYIRKQED